VNLKRGEDLLKQSIAIEPHDFTLNSLANIFQERGDLVQAESLYVQALKISNELQQQINILTAYRDLKSKEGDFESANEMAGQIAALKDSLSRKQKKEAVGMQQVYFDHHVEQEKTASWKWYAKLGIILLLLSLALMYGYYGIRTRRMKRKLLDDQQLLSNRALEIEESAQRIEMLKKKTRLQGDQLRTAERRMEQLKKQQAEAVEQMMNEHKETMMHGNHLFDELENGGSIVRWTNHDIKDFISYYMLKTPLFLTKMEREYARLTPGQQVFLILQDMSFDEEHIKEVLGLTSAAYRTIQSRVNKKILSP
jgi:tetratricopeptide (TPR) repeat protein